MKNYRMIPLKKEHLEMVLHWRNRPEVRRNMYTSHEISMEEHLQWFETISKDNTKQYFVFELESKSVGVIGIVDIDMKARKASWAFYSGDPSVRGIGSLMEIAALDYAFDELKLEKLYCEVLAFNESVLKFHRKHGFQIEGVFKNHHFSNGQYYDVYRLALFKNDWRRVRPEIVCRAKTKFSVGTSFEYEFSINNKDITSFANLVGDNNRIHLSDEVAKTQGFEGRICHGFLVASVFSKVFGTMFPGDGTVYLDQTMRFLAPVYPNTPLLAKFMVISKVGRKLNIQTKIVDKEGKHMIEGEAIVLLAKEGYEK